MLSLAARRGAAVAALPARCCSYGGGSSAARASTGRSVLGRCRGRHSGAGALRQRRRWASQGTSTPPSGARGDAGGRAAGGGSGSGGAAGQTTREALKQELPVQPAQPSAAWATPVTWSSLAVIAAGGLGFLVYWDYEVSQKKEQVLSTTESVGKPALGGEWVLVKAAEGGEAGRTPVGVPVTDATYRGQFTMLYFGFTFCPDICPAEFVKLGAVCDTLASQNGGKCPIQPLFISVDPPRDTIKQLHNYAQDFHPCFEYLTGTPAQIAKVARAYRVYFSKADWQEDDDEDEDYLVDHSIVMYLVGPDGEFIDFFTKSLTAHDITKKVNKAMADYNATHSNSS